MQTSENSQIGVSGNHILETFDIRKYKAQSIEASILNCSYSWQRERQRYIESQAELVLKLMRGQISELDHYLLRFELSVSYKRRIEQIHAEHRSYHKNMVQNFLVEETPVKNITTSIGRSALAQRLGGDVTYTTIINFTSLGDDGTTEDVADATLGSETHRASLTNGLDTSTSAILETYIPAGDATDTHEEFGMWIDGTSTPDTGQLFNRWTETKTITDTQSLNVRSQIDFNDA